MKLNTAILSEAEQERIHLQSLRILAEVGVRYHGQKALGILSSHGAQVDWDRQVACLPEELVEQALQTAPKAFTLAARDPAFDYPLPSPRTGYCMDGTAAFAQDFETGERRYGTSKDIENSMRIFQQLDLGVLAWASTCASDAPAHSRALHEFFGMLRHCSKHGQHELHTAAQVPYLVAGLQAVMGSEAAIRARKEYSLIYCPIAPLSHDGQMLDAYLELGAWDLPVMSMPMPVSGTTGPAGLFANISLANAELLSSLVIFQLAHPGRPVIYSSAVGSLDFTTGAFLGGTPEMGLQSAALTVMGRFYGLPSTSAGCTSDAKQPGAEAVLEKLITTIPPVLAGADIVIGIGEIESDQLLVLEQMVVDNELAHFCQRLLEGVDGGEGRDLFADIAQVGPGGHFLKTRSARQAPRSGEFFMPQLLDRHAYEAWVELGRPSMYSKAREKVRQILESPPVDPLPDAISAELDEILRKADRELQGMDA
jgi:trimethylamine--corrinoid protein Co-methyltransferase